MKQRISSARLDHHALSDITHLHADGVRAADALLALEVGFLARTGHNAEPKFLQETSRPFLLLL